jgi:glycerol kinase
MLGITRGTTAGHIARAALEGIAFQTADVVTAMQKDATIPLKELRVDGGAARNNMLMQFQADILGVPVVRPEVTETTALGTAYLAGLGVGFWSTQDEIAAQWRMERCFEPQMSVTNREEKLGVWTRAIDRAKAWA